MKFLRRAARRCFAERRALCSWRACRRRFQAWLQSLWPQAQALGVSRATFDAATRGLEPDLTLPDLVLPGRPEKPSPGTARIRADAGGLSQRAGDRAARGAGPQALPAIPRRRSTPSSGNSACRRQFCWRSSAAKPITAAPRIPHNAIRVLATQAYLGKRKDKFAQGIPRRAENPRRGQDQARRYEKLLGRRHGAHAISAVGLSEICRRFRRRRPRRYLEFGAGRARLGGQAAGRQGLAARPALGLRGASAGQCRLHHRRAG